MDAKKLIIGALIGGIVGLMSGWQGVSGSVFIQLGLILSGIAASQAMAAGTTLLAMVFPISALAVWNYYKRGEVDVLLAITITLVYMIAAGIGARINAKVSEKTTYFATGIAQGLASLIFFYKAYTAKK